MIEVKKYVERTVTEVTTIPETVTWTLPADLFVAIVSCWSQKFDGWDGPNGTRERLDAAMIEAWDAVFPGVERHYSGHAVRAVDAANARIKEALR